MIHARCIKCGGGGVETYDTRHDEKLGWIKRRKKCVACGARWKSWELPDDALNALRMTALGLQQTLKQVTALQGKLEALMDLAAPAMAAQRPPDGFRESGHEVEPLVPYQAPAPLAHQLAQPTLLPLWRCGGCHRMEIRSTGQPIGRCDLCGSVNHWKPASEFELGEAPEPVAGGVQWLLHERNAPAPQPDSPEWPQHVARICRVTECNEGCDHIDLNQRRCIRLALQSWKAR